MNPIYSAAIKIHRASMMLAYACILLLMGCSSEKHPKPAMQIDLGQYGLAHQSDGKKITSDCYVGFISNEFVLVSINQRSWNSPVEPSNTDTPPSRILIFDTKKKLLVKSGEIRVEKDHDSIQAVANERFVIRNESGMQICDMDFACGQPIAVPVGPLIASPARTSLIVGGYGGTDQLLFDTNSFSLNRRFAHSNTVAIPGDGEILFHDEGHKLSVELDGGLESALPITDESVGEIFLPHSRFLGNSVVGVSESPESLAVVTTKGDLLYHVPINSWYSGATLFASSSGKKFGIFESSYTLWNSITHFYDIEKTRPFDFERIRVLDAATGKPLIEIICDPRPYVPALVTPALSPDGLSLAAIRQNALEVYDLN